MPAPRPLVRDHDDDGPRPDLVCNAADLVLHLDRLRRRAAFGTSRKKVGLDQLARDSGIPRSTLHTYLSGATVPPPDKLDELVVALGCTPEEIKEWAQAGERVADEQHAARTLPGRDDVALMPSSHPRARHLRARGLEHCLELVAPVPASPEGGPQPVATVLLPTWTGTYVYAEPDAGSRRTGYLYAGNNWFICQVRGSENPPLDAPVGSDVWLYTQGDVAHDGDGGWGWAPAVALARVGDHQPLIGVPWRRAVTALE